MKMAILLILVAYLVQTVHSLTITHLSVPSAPIESGGVDSVILGCDFSYNDDDKILLEVKWYFNDESNLVYQWVAGSSPNVAPQFSGVVDLEYVSHTGDKFRRHSGIKLLKPDHRHAGVYFCKVSSLFGEDSKQGELNIYVAPEVVMNITQPNEDNITFFCESKNKVFPEPYAQITWTNRDKSYELFSESIIEETEDSLFSVSISKTLSRTSDLPAPREKDQVIEVICEIGVGDTVEASATMASIIIPSFVNEDSGSGCDWDGSGDCCENSGSGSGCGCEGSGSGCGCEVSGSGCEESGSGWLCTKFGDCPEEPKVGEDGFVLVEDFGQLDGDDSGADDSATPTSTQSHASSKSHSFSLLAIAAINLLCY